MTMAENPTDHWKKVPFLLQRAWNQLPEEAQCRQQPTLKMILQA